MPKRDTDDKIRPDANETAFNIVQAATGDAEKPVPPQDRTEPNPTAAERGRKGGEKGGNARAEKLTAEERSEIAKKAARARWDENLAAE